MIDGVWLGRPGGLVRLPDPLPGVDLPPDRLTGVRRNLSGGYLVTHSGSPRRRWVFRWARLDEAEYNILAGFHSGAYGPGPFVLVEPSTGNLLLPNQASGTDVSGGVDGFVSGDAGATLASSTAGAVQGARCLAWMTAFPANTGRLSLRTPWPPGASSGWYPIPVLAGQPVTFTLYARTTGAAGLRLEVEYLDAAGARLALHANSYAPMAADWTRFQIIRTAGETAAYVAPLARVDATSLGAATLIEVDALQVEYAASPSPWSPGAGVRPVAVVDFDASSPWVGVYDCAMTLVEVG